MLPIVRYLDERLICLLDVETREEALTALVTLTDEAGLLSEKEAFLQAIEERERVVSTGIGMGVAIPHAKLPDYNDFFITIGVVRKGLDWDAMDHNPVRIIFMIGGPDDKQTEYLQILSSLTVAIKNENLRKQLLKLSSPQEIIELFRELSTP